MPIKDYAGRLSANPKLQEFTRAEIETILEHGDYETFAKNDTIIKEGGLGDRMFVVLEGEVSISKNLSDKVVFFITSLKAGDFFGEMSLISDYPRSANAIANTDVKAISLSRERFQEMKKTHPDEFTKLTWVISRTLSERLYKLEERISKILNASLLDGAL